MNIADFVVIGLIVIGGLFGLSKGIVGMVYRLISYILAIVLSIRFAKPVAESFKDSNFYQNMIVRINDSILGQAITYGDSVMEGIEQTIGQLPLPQNIQQVLIQNASENVTQNTQTVADPVSLAVSTSITDFIMMVIAGIALFIILKILFMLIGTVIEKICKAPVIKQLDKSAGFIIGCLIALMIVYSIFTGMTMIRPAAEGGTIRILIEESAVASFLYHNNPIVRMLANRI